MATSYNNYSTGKSTYTPVVPLSITNSLPRHGTLNAGSSAAQVVLVDTPTFYCSIESKAMQKCYAITENVNKEVGWFLAANMQYDEDTNSYYFSIKDDLIIPPQEVTGATAEISPSWHSTLPVDHNDLMAVHNESMKYKAWFHSHVNMDIFASPQDVQTLREMALDNDFYIAGRTNKQGKLRLDIAVNHKGVIMMVNDIQWEVSTDFLSEQEVNEISTLLKDRVKTKTYPTYTYKGKAWKSKKNSSVEKKKVTPLAVSDNSSKATEVLTDKEIEDSWKEYYKQ